MMEKKSRSESTLPIIVTARNGIATCGRRKACIPSNSGPSHGLTRQSIISISSISAISFNLLVGIAAVTLYGVQCTQPINRLGRYRLNGSASERR